MEVVTLSDLAPILAAVVGPMLVFALAMMRYQHVDSTKTRNLMHELIEKSNKENRELIEKSNRENRELIKENRELIEKSSRENRELVEKFHAELTSSLEGVLGSLGEVRERLSRIEGYLWQSPPPPADGDAQAA